MRGKIALVLPSLAVLFLAGCVNIASPPPPSASPSESAPSASPSASPSAAAETFAPGAPANQCLTANLAVSIQDESSSAGHLHSVVVFTNSGATCVLSGYPVVQVVGAGALMGVIGEEDSSATAGPVTLASGGTAVAQLTSVNIDPGGGPLGGACVVGHGDGYKVTPPHSLQPIQVAVANVPVCTNGAAWMTVGPVTAG